MLGVRLTWRLQGVPAGEAGRRRRSLTVYRSGGGSETVSRAKLQRERDAAVRQRIATVGRGGPLRAGPRPELIGRRVADLSVLEPGAAVAGLDAPARYTAVDPRAPRVPSDVSGAVRSARARSRQVAIAVGGRVAATAWTLLLGGQEVFTAIVPPTAFRRGANEVSVYAVARGGALRPLTRPTPRRRPATPSDGA